MDDGKYYRDRFPKNEESAILAYKVKNGKAQVYYKPIDSNQEEYAINYEPYTFKELKELLDQIQA